MYKLKQQPEDFRVEEIPSNVPPLPNSSQGKYLYFKLTKRNRNTLDVAHELAVSLGIQEKRIGFAGNKDKHAMTTQVISFKDVPRERIERATISNGSLEYLGSGDEPISLGSLIGNTFEIVVRNVQLDAGIERIDYVPNYFDEQRFGRQNACIGKRLIQKKFGEAITLIDNPRCREHLAQYPNDAVGALRMLPLRLLRLYVNSYQSFLWNETIAQYLKKYGDVLLETPYSLGTFVFVKTPIIGTKVPLVGFGTNHEGTTPEIYSIMGEILQKEEVTYTDFIIKQIPGLTVEGELRKMFVRIKELHISQFQDYELNQGMKKFTLKFMLGKGSYATIVVRALMGKYI